MAKGRCEVDGTGGWTREELQGTEGRSVDCSAPYPPHCSLGLPTSAVVQYYPLLSLLPLLPLHSSLLIALRCCVSVLCLPRSVVSPTVQPSLRPPLWWVGRCGGMSTGRRAVSSEDSDAFAFASPPPRPLLLSSHPALPPPSSSASTWAAAQRRFLTGEAAPVFSEGRRRGGGGGGGGPLDVGRTTKAEGTKRGRSHAGRVGDGAKRRRWSSPSSASASAHKPDPAQTRLSRGGDAQGQGRTEAEEGGRQGGDSGGCNDDSGRRAAALRRAIHRLDEEGRRVALERSRLHRLWTAAEEEGRTRGRPGGDEEEAEAEDGTVGGPAERAAAAPFSPPPPSLSPSPCSSSSSLRWSRHSLRLCRLLPSFSSSALLLCPCGRSSPWRSSSALPSAAPPPLVPFLHSLFLHNKTAHGRAAPLQGAHEGGDAERRRAEEEGGEGVGPSEGDGGDIGRPLPPTSASPAPSNLWALQSAADAVPNVAPPAVPRPSSTSASAQSSAAESFPSGAGPPALSSAALEAGRKEREGWAGPRTEEQGRGEWSESEAIEAVHSASSASATTATDAPPSSTASYVTAARTVRPQPSLSVAPAQGSSAPLQANRAAADPVVGAAIGGGGSSAVASSSALLLPLSSLMTAMSFAALCAAFSAAFPCAPLSSSPPSLPLFSACSSTDLHRWMAECGLKANRSHAHNSSKLTQCYAALQSASQQGNGAAPPTAPAAAAPRVPVPSAHSASSSALPPSSPAPPSSSASLNAAVSSSSSPLSPLLCGRLRCVLRSEAGLYLQLLLGQAVDGQSLWVAVQGMGLGVDREQLTAFLDSEGVSVRSSVPSSHSRQRTKNRRPPARAAA